MGVSLGGEVFGLSAAGTGAFFVTGCELWAFAAVFLDAGLGGLGLGVDALAAGFAEVVFSGVSLGSAMELLLWMRQVDNVLP
ncbi:MAG: hypothetical protein ACRCSF_03720 [Mycobacteriaceae bacterium]